MDQAIEFNEATKKQVVAIQSLEVIGYLFSTCDKVTVSDDDKDKVQKMFDVLHGRL